MLPTFSLGGELPAPTKTGTKTKDAIDLRRPHPLGFTWVSRKRILRARLLLVEPATSDFGKVFKVWSPASTDHEGHGEIEEVDYHWVNLDTWAGDPCYCRDFTFRAEINETPCKHILAALLYEGDEIIVKALQVAMIDS